MEKRTQKVSEAKAAYRSGTVKRLASTRARRRTVAQSAERIARAFEQTFRELEKF